MASLRRAGLPVPSISVPLRMTVVFGPLLLMAVLLYRQEDLLGMGSSLPRV
jgi:hypothetical protein